MDVVQFKACVTCTATIARDQVPSLSSSNSFTCPLFIYSNTNPNLIMFLTLIPGTKVPQSLFCVFRASSDFTFFYGGKQIGCGVFVCYCKYFLTLMVTAYKNLRKFQHHTGTKTTRSKV
jgi:hypothetical protein